MKSSYVVLTVVIIFALAIGLFVWFQQEDNDAREQLDTLEQLDEELEEVTGEDGTEGDHHEIVYNGGFEPAELAISQGDTVVFKNESGSPIWVASNPHPAHTDYPEFDSRSNINSGQEYSFTFERTGTWGYHNHNNQFETGTITVE